jgi:uncharacterized protein YkwD
MVRAAGIARSIHAAYPLSEGFPLLSRRRPTRGGFDVRTRHRSFGLLLCGSQLVSGRPPGHNDICPPLKGNPAMTRSPAIFLAFVLAPLAVAVEKPDEKKDAKKTEIKLTAVEQAVIDLTNAERKKAEKDLKPLKMNPQLMEAARKHAANMAAQDKLDHKLDDKEPPDRTKAAGYESEFVGENIAWNQKTPKDVLKVWMESELHRENILRPEYTEIGVAMVKNKKGEPYWVQVFGRP